MLDLDTAILVSSAEGGMSCINKSTFHITYFNPCNSGLSSGNVKALEKEPDGTIWLGTNCALIKWQANTWTTYNSQNSILHEGVSSIRYHTPTNTLYIGLQEGGVIKIDTSGWNNVSGVTGTGLLCGVKDIEIDQNGNIWAAPISGSGVYMFDGLNWNHFNSGNCPLIFKANAIAVDSAGIVWIADLIRFVSFNGTSWTNYPGSPVHIRHISIEENNTKWLSTSYGLYIFNGNSFIYHPVNSVLSDIRLDYHLKDKDETLWTGMRLSGVDYADSLNVTNFALSPELDASVIKGIAFDKAQSKVWFATGGSDKPTFLTSFDGTNWEHFNNNNTPVASTTSTAIAVDSNSTVYLGTVYDGLWIKQGNNWTNFNSTNSNLIAGSISSLAVDSMNRLLIGFSKGQIQYYMNGVFYTLINNPMLSCPVNHIRPDHAGSFWASSDSSGAIYCNYAGYTIFNTTNSGIPSNMINDIQVDHLNRCWFASNAGLGMFDGQSWITYNTSNSGLLSDHLIALTIAPDSSVWIRCKSGISGSGFSVFNGTGWNNYSDCLLPIVYGGNIITRMETGKDEKIYIGCYGLNIVTFDYLTTAQTGLSDTSKFFPFPNPGSGNIQFIFRCTWNSRYHFSISDICGRQVYSMPVRPAPSGEIMVMWDTESEHVPAGIYFYTLSGDNIRQSGKVVVQR